MSDLAVLNLEGSPFERGLAHGKALAASIAANIETYLARFEASGMSANAARAEGETWIGAINEHKAAYGEEMRGLAEGAGLALADVAMLNARYGGEVSLEEINALGSQTIKDELKFNAGSEFNTAHEFPEWTRKEALEPTYATYDVAAEDLAKIWDDLG